MPSVLAICDLRRRIRHHLAQGRDQEEDLAALLALDPPAVWRGLRSASSPLYEGTTERWTVPRLVKTLGRAIAVRLTWTEERGMAGTTPIRRLWMRSVATACAARLQAEDSGLLPPDEAYLFGLLRALPTWLKLLYDLRTGRQDGNPDPAVWTSQWNLSAELASVAGVGDPKACADEIHEMLEAAELIAVHAGFTLDDERPTAVPGLLEDPSMAQLANRTRVAVEDRLRSVGLDFTLPDFASGSDAPSAGELSVLGGSARGSIDELTLTLLSFTGAATYRGIITALTAAAIRNGGYDRACYARWCAANGDLVLRSKADLSSRHMARQRVTPSGFEIEAMRLALAEERPVRVDAKPTQPGLLEFLGTDEALLAPLNRDFLSPTFLILDRSLSLEPIRIAADGSKAQTMSLAGSLLVENLLLRKRRDRAHKFAQTDGLTRLLNRSAGMRALDQELARAARSHHEVAVLLCDLDHFKQLNDSFGHLLGDHALRVTADVLRQTVRRTDSISRFGGEEFLVVLPDTDAGDASVLAARLHTAIEERGRDLCLPLTISIGLAMRRPSDTWESILQRADHALYASKGRGRNRFASDAADVADDALPVGPRPEDSSPPT